MKKLLNLALVAVVSASPAFAQLNNELKAPVVKTVNGLVEGVHSSGIRTFKGIPFAAPPTGNFRWREPQPVNNWTGVLKTHQFGPRAMQRPIFGDMGFRSNGMSEDCLYLNVWTPAKTGNERLPVLVYFYGGGFQAGDGSEARYDGESMARRGIVAITINYRLNVFGFFSHPELTKESPFKASGNYGLLDQAAALRWVQANIAAFGGDPKKVTIAGESAGSFSVSAQMASPVSKHLFAAAIGESGSLLNTDPPVALASAEEFGLKFANAVGATSLADLRNKPAEEILQATAKPGFGWFPVNIDGYFFKEAPIAVFAKGQQSKVPLLVGWNSEEMNFRVVMGADDPTKENYEKAVRKLYGEKAPAALEAYSAATDDEVEQAATDLAGDRFIGYSTWKWADVQSKTGGKPVYRYLYERPRPAMRSEMGNAVAGLAGGVVRDTSANRAPKPAPVRGAVHSAEIEYALGNLATNRVYDWQPEDFKVSEIMQAYFANFIKTGDPNGLGVPHWPAITNNNVPVLHIDVNTRVEPEKNRQRYLFIEKAAAK